jgi:hypothetical protein
MEELPDSSCTRRGAEPPHGAVHHLQLLAPWALDPQLRQLGQVQHLPLLILLIAHHLGHQHLRHLVDGVVVGANQSIQLGLQLQL